ncbi:MAG: response regulator [Alphaproteobacteria bacterium]|nr:response regulator [Alphaproteobacteria bacterium]MBV8549181.1 response regulator [Alphaproteobacteria bacterium]
MRQNIAYAEKESAGQSTAVRSFPPHVPNKPSRILATSGNDDEAADTLIYDFLLVEDSRPDAILTKIALESLGMGYNLIHLEKGGDVIPYLMANANNKPDLLILDLGLPDLSGFDVLEHISTLPAPSRDFPIIIVTGYNDFQYVQNNQLLLIKGYVHKSALRLTIHKAVRRALFDE